MKILKNRLDKKIWKYEQTTWFWDRLWVSMIITMIRDRTIKDDSTPKIQELINKDDRTPRIQELINKDDSKPKIQEFINK